MEAAVRGVLESTAMKALVTYYVVTACGLFGLFGALSSRPNRKLQHISLEESTAADESLADKSAAQSQAPSSANAPMKRKLSFLHNNPAMLESNPFMNLSWEITPWERLKCALWGPVLIPPRIALLLSCLFTAYFWAQLSTIGGVDLNKPLPYWRIMLQRPMKLAGRGIMMGIGFVYIKVSGRKASPEEAPIVVSNHISFVETIYLPARFFCMAVSAAENVKFPIFGTLMKALQTVFVERTEKDSRANTAREIERRTKTMRGLWHRQLLIFPEGTTTNGEAIITFKAGAFTPGVPVQPVVIRYPRALTCDPAWVTGGPGPGEIALRLLCQPINTMSVQFLPVYEPSPEEQADPILYANNVRRVMAAALGVRTTEHSFEDVLLIAEAKKLGYQGSLKECVVELKSLRKVLEIDLAGAKEYLKAFAGIDRAKTGRITYSSFVKVFASADTEELRTLFTVLDIRDRGSLNFAEFLTGIALLNEQGTQKFDDAMRLAFKVYDSRGEGKGLCKSDLARLLRRVCDVEATDALVAETFEKADTDSDGLLSVDEFLKLAREHKDEWTSFKTSLFA